MASCLARKTHAKGQKKGASQHSEVFEDRLVSRAKALEAGRKIRRELIELSALLIPEGEAKAMPQPDAACREKLYTLLAVFVASKQIGELCENSDAPTLRTMLDEHETSLATHLLIECAVLIRIKDDVSQRQHGISAETTKDIVGALFI
jgi:hypothetical protein